MCFRNVGHCSCAGSKTDQRVGISGIVEFKLQCCGKIVNAAFFASHAGFGKGMTVLAFIRFDVGAGACAGAISGVCRFVGAGRHFGSACAEGKDKRK